MMRVLLLDIETAPNIVHVWGLYQQNVGINQIVASSYVMCWSAKWLGDSELFFDSVKKSKPEKMVERIHKLVSKADVIVHYNGTSFDMPTLNKEFLKHGFDPPPPYAQVDLYRVVRQAFRFPSNKLEYVARYLEIGEKIKHEGHQLWTECMAGNAAAWQRMEEYNKGDVVLLERLYERVRPWVRNHPNHGSYVSSSEPLCPTCGSANLMKNGWRVTAANKYRRWKCGVCKAHSRSRDGDFDNDARKNLRRPL